MPNLFKCCALGLALLAIAAAARAAAPADPATTLRVALVLGCEKRGLAPAEMAARLPGATGASEGPIPRRDAETGTKWTFTLASGGQVLLERFERGAALSSLVAEYHVPSKDGPRPALAAFAGPSCYAQSGRRIVYGSSGHADAIELLDGRLSPTGERELLRAEAPPGRDPGGVTVAQVDTGVNYLLPEIARHLARDAAGRPLGYDYWEMDAEPFDRHLLASPFLPDRHGTATASVLLREAPRVRLIPYRYPRPDMRRFAALIDDAAAKGARILTMSLGSDDREEWQSFAAAAARHPEMLFVVSAGNDGRDLDREPVYPAALDIANKITVTSADPATGRPAPGSNWGAGTVDLAVAAEEIPATNFEGRTDTVSGSSFAAPRVAALAARLLLEHPEWHAAELERAIFARARPVVAGGQALLRHGAILDPVGP